jgi:hypothetical protein
MLKKVEIQLNSLNDVREDLQGYTIIDSSLGPKNEICILAVQKIPELIDGMFPPVKTKEKIHYRVIIHSQDGKRIINLNNQRWNYHFVQPIDESNILLVCARSHYYESGKFDLNAKVFDNYGNQIREFLLGDGIQNVYVTKENAIWTSYFDEGVYGNYGWENPIGSNGLRAWDSNGNGKYQYPNSDKYFIDDCYALNVVADEEVWFYFYLDFCLARYYKGQIEYFKPDIAGSDGFILYDNYVLFRGEYDKHDNYLLYRFSNSNNLDRKCLLSFTDEQGKTIKADRISCRGSLILVTVGTQVYLADLKDIISFL